MTRPPGVRMLRDEVQLREAVERAREFERRGAGEYQRRMGAYDRVLEELEHEPAIEPWRPSVTT